MFKKKKIFDKFFYLIGQLEANYPKDPFGKKPTTNIENYYQKFNEVKNINHPEIEQLEKDYGYSINKEWIDELALYTQITIKKSKLNYQHGRLLYTVLRRYIEDKNYDNFINVLETGTSRGFSTICMSKAINDGEILGKILSFDILPHQKKMYWNVFFDNYGKSSRQDLLQKWNKELKNIIFIQGSSRTQMKKTHLDRVNFAFLDAEHTYKDVLSEYEYVSHKQIKGDIIVFDDVTPGTFNGVVKAVRKIEDESIYEVKYIKSSDKRGYAIAKKNV